MTDIKERLRKVAGFGGPLITDALARIEELEAKVEDQARRLGMHVEAVHDAVAAERERCIDELTAMADKHRLGDGYATINTNILMTAAAAIRGEADD